MTKIWQDVKGVRGWINELRGKGLTVASGGVLVNGSEWHTEWLMKQGTSRFDTEFDRSLARRG
jgi:hypothetical protein